MRTLRLLLAAGALILGGAACADPYEYDTDSSSSGSSSRLSETVFDDDSCYAQADDLLRENPGVYYSKQNAYDSCRQAGALADELFGNVNRY